MSIDIGWDTITSGPDGLALGEKIRAFVHDKFQQIPLPRFISAVHVHSFDLGTVCPDIEIKDICDPLPDFYEDEEDEEDDREERAEDSRALDDRHDSRLGSARTYDHDSLHREGLPLSALPLHQSRPPPQLSNILMGADFAHLNVAASAKENFGASASPFAGPFPRSTTPGIPGGTSNLSYFHFPGSGLSGTQTPLAAVASGTSFTPGPWSHDAPTIDQDPQHLVPIPRAPNQEGLLQQDLLSHNDPSTRPSTATSISSHRHSESGHSSSPPPPGRQHTDHSGHESVTAVPPVRVQSRQPSDLQVVTRVRYAGDVRMTLTAEILLDYPMPSFVGIPLKLAITGLTFDGVAIVAWVKTKMHFCFLDPEDAATLVGDTALDVNSGEKRGKDGAPTGLLGPLREIHVESEIGRQADGKQVLKNVGKVEKFVLEQVRKIFDEEFVFPSYWTFLV